MKIPFSERTSWDLGENRLTRMLREVRASAIDFDDLTEGNPTHCDLGSTSHIIAELGHARGANYTPLANGHPDALAAVARYYGERGCAIPTDRITLTASTSEAYGWIFKLLCNRGDRVLVPQPSYPLFEFLAALEDVELVPYPLLAEEGWRIDVDALAAAVDPRTRAILLVHPNNPTGAFARRNEALALEKLAANRGLALVVDEVFGDYVSDDSPSDALSTFAGRNRALTFVLSGLSKVCLLPQLKLGWVVISGPDEVAREASLRLEVIADTYLSVAAPVQLALPAILGEREAIQGRVRARVKANMAALDHAIHTAGPDAPVRRLRSDGGWYALLEVPRTRDEDAWVEVLVREAQALVHPGYFFDCPRDGLLVVSLLPAEARFAAAIDRVVRRLVDG